MNLRAVDLNLLVVLDALLEEGHVSRAASRLPLSQPATSSALKRCRELFCDPLILRVGGQMKLTARGEQLRAPVKQALSAVRAVMSVGDPEVGALSALIRIGMADAMTAGIAVDLHRRLQASAPNLSIACLPWCGSADLVRQLDKGDIELAFTVALPPRSTIRHREVAYDTYRVAMRRGHPACESFDLDQWLRFPHLVVSSHGDPRGSLEPALSALGRTRRVGMVLPSFVTAMSLLSETDCLALLPSLSFCGPLADALVSREPPIPMDGFPVYLCWHERHDSNPAVRQVIALLEQSVVALKARVASSAAPCR